MATKRQINSNKFDVTAMVTSAITTADAQEISASELEKAQLSLARLGHRNPASELVQRYARESEILRYLERETGANFGGQIGKIDFSNTEKAISGVNGYLNRRINGQHVRYAERKNH